MLIKQMAQQADTLLPLLAISLSCPLLSHAQSIQGSELGRDNSSNFNNGYSTAPANTNTVQGSPFLLPRWETAALRLAPDRPPITVPLKYDVYHQELRVRRPPGDSVVVPLTQVHEFTVSGATPTRRFVYYLATTLPAEVGGAAAEVLADGTHAQLLKFVRKIVVKQASEGSGYASNSSIDVLEEQKCYYLRWPADGHFMPIRLKRSGLEQALAGQPTALATLKTRKGSLSTEAEVAAAVGAIDPLLSTQVR
jgi:hypothetical protein